MKDLKDCFDINTVQDTIRLKGTRIGWEYVIEAYQQGVNPETIADSWFGNPLPLSNVYGAITYYLLNPDEFDDYCRRGEAKAAADYARYWNSLSSEERERQTAIRDRQKDLRQQFTKPDGKLDVASLRAYMEAERAAGAGV